MQNLPVERPLLKSPVTKTSPLLKTFLRNSCDQYFQEEVHFLPTASENIVLDSY